MPPHCDALDGPVVTAARAALDARDVDLVLPYVHEEGESEVRTVFTQVIEARALGDLAADVADRLFFETVVRVHRAGENAPYTGLKPTGLDVGPAIPMAERAVMTRDVSELADFLSGLVRDQLRQRMERLRELDAARDGYVARERAYVEAMLGFEVYSHRLFTTITSVVGH